MALNFNKNSYTAEQFIAYNNGEGVERPQFNKTAWFNMPNGLELFPTPQQEGVVKFDVIDFTISQAFHPWFANKNIWDVTGRSFWNFPVVVHEIFPKSLVCNKTFKPKIADNDAVCNYLWDNKDTLDFRKVKKTYTILLLRLHPNAELGITDFKYVVHIDTNGKLAKAISELWEKAIARKEVSKISFSNIDDGLTLEAFFHKIPTKIGLPFWGCDDVSFVKREVPIPDADKEFLSNLDICSCVQMPTEDDVNAFMEHIKQNPPLKDGAVVSTKEPVVQNTQPAVNPAPVPPAPQPVAQPVKEEPDPAFANPVKLEEEAPASDDDWMDN